MSLYNTHIHTHIHTVVYKYACWRNENVREKNEFLLLFISRSILHNNTRISNSVFYQFRPGKTKGNRRSFEEIPNSRLCSRGNYIDAYGTHEKKKRITMCIIRIVMLKRLKEKGDET